MGFKVVGLALYGGEKPLHIVLLLFRLLHPLVGILLVSVQLVGGVVLQLAQSVDIVGKRVEVLESLGGLLCLLLGKRQ